jgi:signal peptidase I
MTPLEPWLAAAASVLVPGLGQAACGRPGRGVFWLVGSLGSTGGFLWWVLDPVRAGVAEAAGWLAATAAFQLGAWIDAYRIARRAAGPPPAPRPPKRPEPAAALSLLWPGLGQAYLMARRWWMWAWLGPLWALPAAVLLVATAAEEPPVEWWPRWLLDWPAWAAVVSSAAVSAAAVTHAWVAGCRRAGRAPAPPRLAPAVAALAALGWINGQLPWEDWLKRHLVRSFVIPSSSMEPTLVEGDRLWARRTTAPARGDIVVFTPPDQPNQEYIKRVAALPGETLEIIGTTVYVDGRPMSEPWAVYRAGGGGRFGPVKVPDGHYFVLGDNRDFSRDSRFFGPVPAAAIYGRAFKRFWPPGRAGPLSPSSLTEAGSRTPGRKTRRPRRERRARPPRRRALGPPARRAPRGP